MPDDARHVRVVVYSIDNTPESHPEDDQAAQMYIDEIIV